MHADQQLVSQLSLDLSRRGAVRASAVAAILVIIFAIYWKTTLAMATVWATSQTFAHGFVVIPVFLFLLWRRKSELAAVEPKPFWPALAGVIAAGILWLAGQLAHAAVVTEFAIVAMVPLAVLAVLGTGVVRVLAIPLAFLFFAVPFGEFLMPTMMDWTADFTVLALRASGVPVLREGNYFSIPSGNWSIVEGCSGVRYLIASLMVGCLYAYLTYRSPLRRAAFIAASLVVPIVANWLRAYMIVMIGHLSDNQLAVGVDHLVYGWLFFGIVIALMLWVGSLWREDDAPQSTAPGSEVPSRSGFRPLMPVALATLVIAAIWQPLAAGIERRADSGAVHLGSITLQQGWTTTTAPVSTWRPDLSGAKAETQETFVRDGRSVTVYIAFFRDQADESKAITASNELVSTKNNQWKEVRVGRATVDIGGAATNVRTAVVTNNLVRLAVWQWYWVDGHLTSSEYMAKLYEALSVVLGHGDATAWVMVYTTATDGYVKSEPALQEFSSTMGGAINAALEQAASK